MTDTATRGKFFSGWTLLGAVLGFACGVVVPQFVSIKPFWVAAAEPVPASPSGEVVGAPGPDNTIVIMPPTAPGPDNTLTTVSEPIKGSDDDGAESETSGGEK